MKLLTSGTIICRVGYCSECEKNNRPHTGQLFKTVGSHGAHIYEADRIARWYGFTPHIYVLHKFIYKTEGGGDVVFDCICAMYGCGIRRYPNNQDQCWEYTEESNKWKRGIMELKDWNALVSFKKDPDYFI